MPGRARWASWAHQAARRRLDDALMTRQQTAASTQVRTASLARRSLQRFTPTFGTRRCCICDRKPLLAHEAAQRRVPISLTSMTVWLVSSSRWKWKLGSSCASLYSPLPILSRSAFVFGSIATCASVCNVQRHPAACGIRPPSCVYCLQSRRLLATASVDTRAGLARFCRPHACTARAGTKWHDAVSRGS